MGSVLLGHQLIFLTYKEKHEIHEKHCWVTQSLKNSETIQRKIPGRCLVFPHEGPSFSLASSLLSTHHFSVFESFPRLLSIFRHSMLNKKVKQKSSTHAWSSSSHTHDKTTRGHDTQIMNLVFLKPLDSVAPESLADRMGKVDKELFDDRV